MIHLCVCPKLVHCVKGKLFHLSNYNRTSPSALSEPASTSWTKHHTEIPHDLGLRRTVCLCCCCFLFRFCFVLFFWLGSWCEFSYRRTLCACGVWECVWGEKGGGGMLPPARGKLSVSFIQELATIVNSVEFAAGVNEQLCAKSLLSVCRFLQCWNSF